MASTARQSLSTIESFLATIGGEKVAEANTEAGSQGGATSHPVKSVEDNTRPAAEGARSAENTKDVKKDQGDPSVDATPEAGRFTQRPARNRADVLFELRYGCAVDRPMAGIVHARCDLIHQFKICFTKELLDVSEFICNIGFINEVDL